MSESKDFIRNSLIAMTTAIPYVGGTISFLLDKYIPSEANRRHNDFVQSLARDLEELKEKIDISYFESPEFHSVFMKLLNSAVEEYREEKLLAYRNLLVNAATYPNRFKEIDYFAKLVVSLVPDEIVILKVFYKLDVKGELKEYDTSKKRNIQEILAKLYLFDDKEYAAALLTDIQIHRLAVASQEMKRKVNREGMFLTDFGKEFLNYILKPKEGDLVEMARP